MASIEIYTTPTCYYCTAAKALLRRKGVAFNEIDVYGNPELRALMTQRAGGSRTVPQIFIGDTHVGGCDDLMALDQRGGLLPAFDQQQNVLSQGCMHVRRYLPDRTGAQATINQQLGQRQKTQLCVAGGHELVGLRNVLALHKFGL